MTRQLAVQQSRQDQSGWSHLKAGTLQRKCSSCGNHSLDWDECSECRKKKWKGLQTKLKIGKPNDVYEREADRIADQVMAMPTPVKPNKTPIKVQRFSDHATPDKPKAPPGVVRALNSYGSPLPSALAKDMGRRFNHDFSDIRVHIDSSAAQSAEDINADAYTVGRNIVFGKSRFLPETFEGRKLIAHELAHPMQQSETTSGIVQTQRSDLEKTSRSPTTEERRIISAARRSAKHRVSVAYLRINGTSPLFNRNEELATVRGLISPDIVNFKQIVDIVRSMLSRLSWDSQIVIGPEITQCRAALGWTAYVRENHPPIHLCERFFRKPHEEQVRTLIHEAAHASGIGQSGGETYFAVFDCSPSPQNNWDVADAWARYIHCISGQSPDQP